jgi:hypothetical protein
MHVATARPYRSLPWSERLPLFASGAVSAVGWTCAIAIAFYIFG